MSALRINGLIGQPQGFDELMTDYFDEKKLQNFLDSDKDKSLKIQINSGGGYTDAGLAMYDLLKTSDKEIEVDVLKICGSIATVLLLTAKKGKRRAHKNSEIFIHNPYWIPPSPAPVTREDAQRLDKELAMIEDRIMSIYLANTDADRATLENLMKAETALTPEEAMRLGFIDEVIQYEIKDEKRFPVMAFIEAGKNKNNTMTINPTDRTWLEKQFTAILDKFKKLDNLFKPVFNMMVELQSGGKIFVDSDDDNWVGKKVFNVDAEGKPTTEPAADGDYVTKDGKTIVVKDGAVLEVKEKTEAPGEVMALKKQVEELTNQLKASNEAKVQVETSLNTEKEKFNTEIKNMKSEVEKFRGMVLGNDVPPADQIFRGDKTELSGDAAWLAYKRKKAEAQNKK